MYTTGPEGCLESGNSGHVFGEDERLSASAATCSPTPAFTNGMPPRRMKRIDLGHAEGGIKSGSQTGALPVRGDVDSSVGRRRP